MYLSKIHIVNFKSLKDVTFEFHPKVNILTGVNNAGKTTVLEAIALWHECYRKLIRQALKSVKGQYKTEDYILGATTPTYVSYNDITSVRSPNYEDLFYNLETDSKKAILLNATLKSDKGETIDIPLSLSRTEGDNYLLICDKFRNFDFKLFNTRSFLNDPMEGIQLTYSSPINSLLSIEERQTLPKIKYLKQSRASAQVFRNRLELLFNRRNGDFERFVDELKSILTNGVSDIRFSFDNDNNNINEIVKIKIGRESLKEISLLGSGTLQIIEILLSLFEDKKDLNIILLDEPNSHIHHTLQKRLLETLEKLSHSNQVFLTTHNIDLLQVVDLEWVFHLEQQAECTYRPIINEENKELKIKMDYAQRCP
jgi:predicted ATP-dependent endonuclease of OLD family